VSKLVKEHASSPRMSALTEELDNRINELKKMRDGAEMDLDLDITQRMLENDEQDISHMSDVVKVVSVACDMLEDENLVLADELEF